MTYLNVNQTTSDKQTHTGNYTYRWSDTTEYKRQRVTVSDEDVKEKCNIM